MNRGDYIQTREGQQSLLRQRRFNRLGFVIPQQPKGKNSIRESEKNYFQQEVLQTLQNLKRRAYRSPVIIELDFYCNQKNPPAIYNLPKNYLDLLHKPIKGSSIKRKRLLYSDDRLIKFLIVNYHLTSKSEPGIFIKIGSFRNFIEDIRLLEKIIHNDFEDSSYSSFDIHEIENDDTLNFSDSFDKLRDLSRDKDSIISVLGEDGYNIMKDFSIQDAQKDYLEIGKIAYSSLSYLFGPYLDKAEPSDISNFMVLIQ